MKKGCWITLLVSAVIVGGFTLLIMALGSASGPNPFSLAPVAVVRIEGPIFEVEDTLKELEEFRESETVKAVVVRINSPGGAIGPSQEVFEQIKRVRAAGKKVIISMGALAASGGYYIASAGDKIVANSGTITGSIGVIMQNFGVERVLKTLNIQPRTITSGKYKDAGTPFREMTSEDRDYLQSLADQMYEIFLKDIAEARGMPLEKVRTLAEGKIYAGAQAKELGLVDELGNLYVAIDIAKKEAGLPEDAKIRWPKEPSPFEAFFEERAMIQYLKKFLAWEGFQGLPSWTLQVTGI